MRTQSLTVLLVAASLSHAALGQNITMTVTAGPAGNASAFVNSNYAPPQSSNLAPPNGVVVPGVVYSNLAQLGTSYAESDIEVRDQLASSAAPFSFAVVSSAAASVHPPVGAFSEAASSTMDLRLRLTLTASQPTSGRLLVRWQGQACDLANASVQMDLGADGTIEQQTGQLTCAAPQWFVRDLPLVIGSQPFPIELVVHNDASASAMGPIASVHGATVTLECMFFPGAAVVESFDTTGASAGMFFEHREDGIVDLRAFPSGQPALFAFGAAPTVVPWSPTLTQLVVIDTFTVANQLQLPMPLLPPGSELFCQALVVSPAGELLGTRSLRAFWP